MQIMTDIYITCLTVGGMLMLISMILSFLDGLDGVLDGALDCLQIHIDLAFLPLSGTSICGGIAMFGAVGLTVNNLIISIVVAYIFAVLVQIGVTKLKKSKSGDTLKKEDLYMYTGKIVNTVLPGKCGCVLFQALDGTRVKYPCKSDDETQKIVDGTEVKLIRFDKSIAIIELDDKLKELQEKYEN